MVTRKNSVLAIVWLTCAAAAFAVFTGHLRAQSSNREVTIRGDQFSFAPTSIEVQKDNLVKITFTAVDIPHSFTMEGYRIAKRAAAGQTVTFEFRADRAGKFAFVCNLTQDDRCRKMEGRLIVR